VAVGLLFGVFAALAATARVFLGIHYPSDVVAGALLGIVTSVALNREAVRQRIAAPILSYEARYPPWFYIGREVAGRRRFAYIASSLLTAEAGQGNPCRRTNRNFSNEKSGSIAASTSCAPSRPRTPPIDGRTGWRIRKPATC
jgi:hypothetical protein